MPTPSASSSASSSAHPSPGWLERALEACGRLAMPLSLAITLLLFLQWPLRDLVGIGAPQANDLAQWLFALYVAVALGHAGRRGAHLVSRPDLSGDTASRLGRWRRIGAPLGVLPWALFVAISAAPPVLRSALGLERFPETGSPGYFIVKLALMLLAVLMVAQALVDLRRACRSGPKWD